MDIANEMANYLAGAGFGTVGTDIFVGQIPAETNGIYVVHSGGSLHDYVPIETPLIDIYCKNTSASDCIATLEQIKRHIHRMYSTSTSNSYIYSILAIGDIEDIERDVEYAKIYKISVSVMCRDNTLIS